MFSLDYFCIFVLILSSVHGLWRGWTVQGFYLLMAFTLYALALKINSGSYSVFFIPESDSSFRDIMHLEVISIIVIAVLILMRRFHSLFFVNHHALPGHQVVGAIFGFLTGLFGLLYLFVWINFTDIKMQPWWTSSLEYQLSQSILDLIRIFFG